MITLDSIVKQDNGHIEIICINDGSTDGSEDILHAYERKYSFFHAFHQENQGVAAARNIAMRKASGTWLCFVDSDDIITDGTVQLIQKKADQSCDIIYFDYQRFTEGLPRIQQHNGQITFIESQQITKLQSDCINRLASNTPIIPHTVQPTPWGKIYRRLFIESHDLSFQQGLQIEEDVLFNLSALSFCQKAAHINFVMYCYRWSIDSASHKYNPHVIDNVKKALAAYREILSTCYQGRKDMQELYRYRVLWELLYCVALGPIHAKNLASYRTRRQQFMELVNDPLFAEAIGNVPTTRFEWKQSILATLTKLHQFWLLNILGKMNK